MQIAISKEAVPGERRVALVPELAAGLVKTGVRVALEAGAGEAAGFPDEEYRKAGVEIATDASALFKAADLLLKVQGPAERQGVGHEADLLREGAAIISFLFADSNSPLLQKLLTRKVTAFAMERVPRISRAQKMDALSSQSTAAGYLAAILAAQASPKFFPLLMTAAGTVTPAKVFVLGAGVAGLQAIATARRLGARVEAFDVRPAVKEQVESLGASFVGLTLEGAEGKGGYAKELSEESHRKEQALIAERLQKADVVITTALIPGKPAPRLITRQMAEAMKPGSVIVDLAAEQGGNCELTQAGQTVTLPGQIQILGPLNLPSALAFHSSQMYSKNITAFLEVLLKEGKLNLNFEDQVIGETCVAHQGEKRI